MLRSSLISACSNKSDDPDLDDTPRLPCLAMVAPEAAMTKEEAVETLNKF